MNWLVPYVAGDIKYAFVERTLCLFDYDFRVRDQEVTVVLSTASGYPIDFAVTLYEIRHFDATLNKYSDVKGVSVSTPVYRYVDLTTSSEDHLLELRVESKTGDVCAITSLQPFQCPVSDLEETVRQDTDGSYQTMLQKSAFNVDRRKFGDGALVVFIVTSSDEPCGINLGEHVDPDRSKDFEFILADSIERKKVGRLVGSSLGLLSAVCLVAIVLTCFCSQHGKEKKIRRRVEKVHERQVSVSMTALNEAGGIHAAADDDEDRHHHANDDDTEAVTSVRDVVDNYERKDNKKGVAAERRYPEYVSELSKMTAKEGSLGSKDKKLRIMFLKSELYAWLTLIVGMFYGVPALQLVLNHNYKLLDSGDQDMCYYNFYCAIPAMIFSNFNNIFSNIYYLIFGILFLILTWHRKRQYTRFLERIAQKTAEEVDSFPAGARVVTEFGIPQHFGMFYAMGYALIMECFFSSFYHVCPSDENFQFDTTFMYIIASLSFLKIYQFRHPDITTTAYKVFFGIGLVLFSEAIGIFYGNTVYWVLTLIVYFFLIVCLLAILYHPGEWSFSKSLFVQMYRSVRSRIGKDKKKKESPKPKASKKRLILVLVLLVLNLLLLIIGAITTPNSSSYILMIFIGNLLVYVIYYLIMKIFHREKLTINVYVYSALAIFSWIIALIFYNNRDTDTTLSPAQSRNLNRECIALDMYDHHDIWHMFSAMGLFQCFMLFLNLEDGIFDVPRNEIPIF